MNGIKFKSFYALILSLSLLWSCQEMNVFTEDVFVYTPSGKQVSIAQLKAYPLDRAIEEDIYVQGTVTSSDENGNFARRLVVQDHSGAIIINIGMGDSHKTYPLAKKVSVQCHGLVLAEVGGVLQLASAVSGEGIRKEAIAMDNRQTRMSVFPFGEGDPVSPVAMSLSELDPVSRTNEGMVVKFDDVFFQTALLPFANAGGSSEQFRTLLGGDNTSLLLCTSDGASIAATMLPQGKGSVVGVLTYPQGRAQVMVNGISDITFLPSVVNTEIQGDVVSNIFISEFYSFAGKHYIEIYNAGAQPCDLSEYYLATDTESNGEFSVTKQLDNQSLASGGIVLYRDQAANLIPWIDTPTALWDPLRTNYSSIRLDGLNFDGNSQIALLKGSQIVDIFSTTGRYNWAQGHTFVRRPSIEGHSKASDFTRADAGWSTKIAGYYYNLGHHKFYDTDPDMDTPLITIPKTILEIRSIMPSVMVDNFVITGRVTSDRVNGNVEPNRLFMQDGSNRGICVAFRSGQNHTYNAGDEIELKLYGTKLMNENGLLVVADAMVSHSQLTASLNQMPVAIEASVDQIESLQSMYIYIKDSQINATESGKQYGSGLILSENLFNDKFWLSTLNGASFSSQTVASNSGVIKGIASQIDSKLLLLPRNSADLSGLTAPHFTPVTASPITVADLLQMPEGNISTDVRVTVSVVSDFTGGNYVATDQIFVQDASRGFILKLPSTNSYSFGQSLIVVLNGANSSTVNGKFVVTPSSADKIVAVGAPDPSLQPTLVDTQSALVSGENAFRLVTITGMEVSEADRLKKFDGTIVFKTKLSASTEINVITNPSAQWKGAYIPTASGSVTGLLTRNGSAWELYPQHSTDFEALPDEGTRNNGEKVVYFAPSLAAGADLFISEAVIGQVDANGNIVQSVARNNCNVKFVELFNPTGNDLDLSLYRVACFKYNNSVARGTIVYYQFPANLYLKPGRTAVFKYVSNALGTTTTTKMTNTVWPKGYTGDNSVNSNVGVVVHEDVNTGYILFSDTRDYGASIANAVQAFPGVDGNDILVVQKSTDGGVNWTEIDRLFSLRTANGTIGGAATYPYLFSYQRKQGKIGVAGSLVDVQDSGYASFSSGSRNQNDFESTQCDPDTGGASNWTKLPANSYDDLGIHRFSIKP